MAAGARRINIGILFTNRKLPSIHSESVPRSRPKLPKAVAFSYAERYAVVPGRGCALEDKLWLTVVLL